MTPALKEKLLQLRGEPLNLSAKREQLTSEIVNDKQLLKAVLSEAAKASDKDLIDRLEKIENSTKDSDSRGVQNRDSFFRKLKNLFK